MECDIKPGNYFPMFLGNGVDGVLVDWTGSMSFKDHFNGVFCYWHKIGRYPTKKDNYNLWSSWADPVPIVRSGYILRGEESRYEIESSKQEFDPRQAILHTIARATDYELEIETYLTSDHLLIEHYLIKKVPSKGRREMVFFLNDPRVSYTGLHIEKLDVEYANVGNQVFARYGNENFTGGARMWVEKIRGGFKVKADAQLKLGGEITLGQLSAGDEFVKYLCVVDNMDSENYMDFLNAIYTKARRRGFKNVRELHIEEWRKYNQASDIRLEDKFVEDMYHLSLYLLRAMQHPEKGFIPTNFFPTNHGGRTYWDSWYSHQALLYANRVEEAEKLALFWRRILPISRKYARIWGVSKGARFGWSVTPEGESPDLSCTQFHNNGVVALTAWEQYEYTGDKRVLEKLYPVIKEAVEFLVDTVVEEKESLAMIKPIESLDETFPRENCTWTLALILKGIEILTKANRLLGYETDFHLIELSHKLQRGLELNKVGGILYPYKPSKDRLPHLNVGSILPFWLFPELYNKETVDAYLEDAKELDGLGWGKGSRMRCRIFPWAETIAAATLAKGGDYRAYEHLVKAISCTNSYGGIPEYLWFPYQVSRQWYLAAHATFIIALRNIFVTEKNNKICLLQALPEEWQDVEIKNFRLKGGLLLSLQIKAGIIKRLILQNTSSQEIEREILVGRVSPKQITIKIGAGEKKVIIK